MRVPPGLLLESEQPRPTSGAPADGSPSPLDRGTFFAAAGLIAALFIALRAWALAPSWFYADDHRLLGQAHDAPFGLAYLTEPFDSQFMPLGRAVAWLVSHDLGGHAVQPSWAVAVTVSLALTAASAATCLWMLTVAFGRRWEVLALYGIALTSTTALPAAMWWAASLNQVPLLIVWSGAIAAGLRYLQTRRLRWVGALLGLLVLGLLAYVKTVVVVVALAYVALTFFARGSLRERLTTVATSYRPAVASVVALVGAFTVYYLLVVPSVVSDSSIGVTAGPLADRLVGTSWASAALGGPWRWDDFNAPVSITDPPDWAVHLSWVLIILVVAYSILRRTGAARGWGFIGLGLLSDYALLLVTRAPAFGAVAGNEMRYLTEASLYVALGVGLALLPLQSSVQPSMPRQVPLLRVRATPVVGLLLTSTIVAGSLASTFTYVHTWHTNNPGRAYLDTVAGATRDLGRLELVDTRVPENVMSPVLAPYNTAGVLVPLHLADVEFPDVSADLRVLSAQGQPTPALIDSATTSTPGEVTGCGRRIGPSGLTIPLSQATLDYDWWLRVGYLSSQRSSVTVTAGDVTRTSVVNPGLGSLFVHASGAFDRVRISGLDAGTTLCVDVVEVGVPVAGEGS